MLQTFFSGNQINRLHGYVLIQNFIHNYDNYKAVINFFLPLQIACNRPIGKYPPPPPPPRPAFVSPVQML